MSVVDLSAKKHPNLFRISPPTKSPFLQTVVLPVGSAVPSRDVPIARQLPIRAQQVLEVRVRRAIQQELAVCGADRIERGAAVSRGDHAGDRRRLASVGFRLPGQKSKIKTFGQKQ